MLKNSLLVRKVSLDALLNALNTAPDYPAADKEYEHPFGSKGTELEETKYGAVDIHETPRKLPPRDDLRRHIDPDLKQSSVVCPVCGNGEFRNDECTKCGYWLDEHD